MIWSKVIADFCENKQQNYEKISKIRKKIVTLLKNSWYLSMELLRVKPKKAVKKTAKKKKKPKSVKYSITLSGAENTLLTKVCKKDGTTQARLIKSVLRKYLKERISSINDEISENQLNLFKNPKSVQYKIDE